MKKVNLVVLIIVTFIFLSASTGVGESQNKDRSGSPDGANVCSQCHSTTVFSTEVDLTITNNLGIEVLEYIPGETYLLTYHAVAGTGNPAGFGFQSTALLSTNMNAGEFLNPGIQVQLETINNANVNNREVVEHSSPSSSGIWEVEWIAPSEPSGDVTFYYSSIAANGNSMSSGDTYGGGTLTIPANGNVSIESLKEKELQILALEETIVIYKNKGIIGNVSVYSVTGEQVYSRKIEKEEVSFSRSELVLGINIIVVENRGQISSFKISNL